MPREVVPIFTRPGAFSDAIADKQAAVHLHAGFAQRRNLLEQRDRVEDHAVANHASAAGAQDAARNKLKNEFFAVDDNGVTGVVAAGIAGNDREVFRENVDDLAFTLVAPLRTYDDRSLALLQSQLRGPKSRPPRPHLQGRTHSKPTVNCATLNYKDLQG